MGAKVSRTDFEWISTAEPHTSRREEILRKYPEIKKLYGVDTNFKWIVLVLIFLQLMSLPLVLHLSWPSILIASYWVSGVINHSLMFAAHDTAHHMAFGPGYPLRNELFGILINLPAPVPYFASFKFYHLLHHRYQGEAGDPDMPTDFEGRLFSTTFGKFVWICFLPLFYLLRPVFVLPKFLSKLELLNIAVQLAFDVLLYRFFGMKALVYLTFGSVLSMGPHPVAGHFIAEHFMFEKGFETYSYYGPLNYILFNAGYHMEHHDFPFIPSSRLPLVRKIAAEYYDILPYHNSYISVLYHFIMDADMSLYSRVKRKNKCAD